MCHAVQTCLSIPKEMIQQKSGTGPDSTCVHASVVLSTTTPSIPAVCFTDCVGSEPRDGSINSKTRRRRHLSPILSHKPQYDWARCIQPCAKMKRTATIGHLKAKEDDRYSKEHAFDRSSVENLFQTVGHYSFRKVYRTPALCIDFDL